VRLESPERGVIQIRWSSNANPNAAAVRSYLSRLRSDAKKAAQPFDSDLDENDGRVHYSYKGELHGFGAMFKAEGDSRSFFLEASGPGRKTAKSLFEKCFTSFGIPAPGLEPWCLLGLDVSLPPAAKLQGKELKAGKTRLEFTAKGAKIVAERWGFAQQLLARQTLAAWLAVAFKLSNATYKESECGVEAFQARFLLPPIALLAKPNVEKNQIEVILVESRSDEWRPEWGWFNS